MVDGNFTAQHMRMRKPKDDVSLSDGLAYMVANEPYQKHVAQAANNEEVCIIGPLAIICTFMLILHLLEVNMSKPPGC